MRLSKIVKIVFIVPLLVIGLPAASDSDSSVKKEWKEFGKKSADAFKSFGKAMGETGKKIGEDIQNSLTPNTTVRGYTRGRAKRRRSKSTKIKR